MPNNIISKTLTFTRDNLTHFVNFPNFFQASSTLLSTPVADIRITKEFNSPNVITTIEARGHNTGIIGRRVERGISQTHN
ncbi:MAG: hypothetical protein ABH971_00150 [bacterium]